ncbi:MAG: TIGR00730 family Rossman fold protein [Alphaproteobacteria bacterium]
MSELKTICVYCGSSTGHDHEYAEAATALGEAIAAAGVRLVYGGGSVGLMGIVARTVMARGGHVIGVIPQFLKDREVMLKEVTELVVTEDMHERKRIMFDHADAFVTLPGGIGTLEEVIEMTSWAQLDQHAKPIVMVNIGGFWDPLVAQFRRMTDDGFLTKTFLGDHRALPLNFVDSAEESLPKIRDLLAGIAPEDLTSQDGARLM